MEYITKEFLDRKWSQTKDSECQHVFEKNEREFAITSTHDKVLVSTPLNNSRFNYEASFIKPTDFNEIHEFIVNKLNYLEN